MPAQNFYNANIASGGRVYPLTNWVYEQLPWPALVQIGMIHDGAANGLLGTVSSGSDILLEDAPISAGGTDGVFPNDEQLDLNDEAAAGDKLKITARENAAAATTDLMTRVKLTPLI